MSPLFLTLYNLPAVFLPGGLSHSGPEYRSGSPPRDEQTILPFRSPLSSVDEQRKHAFPFFSQGSFSESIAVFPGERRVLVPNPAGTFFSLFRAKDFFPFDELVYSFSPRFPELALFSQTGSYFGGPPPLRPALVEPGCR